MTISISVSYTHLDVYKRQVEVVTGVYAGRSVRPRQHERYRHLWNMLQTICKLSIVLVILEFVFSFPFGFYFCQKILILSYITS